MFEQCKKDGLQVDESASDVSMTRAEMGSFEDVDAE